MTGPTGTPTSHNSAAGGFQVDPEALLKASDILQNEVDRLTGRLGYYSVQLVVGICGPDPISQPAADGFNAKIQAIVQEAKAYVAYLTVQVTSLKDAAKSYGATDEQAQQALQAASTAQAQTGYPLRLAPSGPVGTTGSMDPERAIMRPYTPPSPATPRAPGDLSPQVDPPSAGPANPFPGLGTRR